MPDRFARHLSNANDHLEAASAALAYGDYEETVICLRCFLAEVDNARRSPVRTEWHEDLLADLMAAAVIGEAVVAQHGHPLIRK